MTLEAHQARGTKHQAPVLIVIGDVMLDVSVSAGTLARGGYVHGEVRIEPGGSYSHKAGMHLKAMMTNPGSYEIIPPEAFGLSRRYIVGSRLTGKHAIAYRAREMGITFGESELKAITRRIKEMADRGQLSEDQIDEVLREWVTA